MQIVSHAAVRRAVNGVTACLTFHRSCFIVPSFPRNQSKRDLFKSILRFHAQC